MCVWSNQAFEVMFFINEIKYYYVSGSFYASFFLMSWLFLPSIKLLDAPPVL
jgi:hypothetical protein